ncbi:MAG: glycogen/starch synthase [Anaerolineae bacterium]|nr:glycogen/starch synthase [Anaerolineae bacterium]
MTAPLRIAFIAGEYPPLQGGLGDYTRELGRALVQAGHDVRVVTRRVEASLAPTDERAQGEPRVLRVVAGWDWRAWLAVRQAVRGRGCGHIQYQTAAYDMHPFINTLPWLLRMENLAILPLFLPL